MINYIQSKGLQFLASEGGLSLREGFLTLLREMDRNMKGSLKDLLNEFSLTAFLSLLLLAFLYGVLHSAGPGHGKTLVGSYFLKEKHPLRRALLLSGVVSLVHSGSAIILAFLLTFVLTGIKGMFKIKMQSYFMLASGIMIIIIGLTFLVLKIVGKKECSHGEYSHDSRKSLFFVGLTAGIVPCPVSLMIMLFTISRKIALVGLAAVLSISLGMFTLLGLLGLVSIKSRDGILLLFQKFGGSSHRVATLIEYLSIIMIILLGAVMTLKMFLPRILS